MPPISERRVRNLIRRLQETAARASIRGTRGRAFMSGVDHAIYEIEKCLRRSHPPRNPQQPPRSGR